MVAELVNRSPMVRPLDARLASWSLDPHPGLAYEEAAQVVRVRGEDDPRPGVGSVSGNDGVDAAGWGAAPCSSAGGVAQGTSVTGQRLLVIAFG